MNSLNKKSIQKSLSGQIKWLSVQNMHDGYRLAGSGPLVGRHCNNSHCNKYKTKSTVIEYYNYFLKHCPTRQKLLKVLSTSTYRCNGCNVERTGPLACLSPFAVMIVDKSHLL